MIADLGTRYGEVYAPVDEVLLSSEADGGDARDLGREKDHAPDGQSGEDRFARSRERFELILGWLGGEETGGLEHSDLEARLQSDGRELLRVLFQDALDLRAEREQRVDGVSD